MFVQVDHFCGICSGACHDEVNSCRNRQYRRNLSRKDLKELQVITPISWSWAYNKCIKTGSCVSSSLNQDFKNSLYLEKDRFVTRCMIVKAAHSWHVSDKLNQAEPNSSFLIGLVNQLLILIYNLTQQLFVKRERTWKIVIILCSVICSYWNTIRDKIRGKRSGLVLW